MDNSSCAVKSHLSSVRSLLTPSETCLSISPVQSFTLFERFLVRHITGYDDVVCFRLSTYTGILNWRGLLNTVSILLTLVTDCHRVHDVGAAFHALLPTSSGERSSCPGFRNVVDDSALLVLVPLCRLVAATLSVSLASNSSSALLRGHTPPW